LTHTGSKEKRRRRGGRGEERKRGGGRRRSGQRIKMRSCGREKGNGRLSAVV
jgi:hypothetical protein